MSKRSEKISGFLDFITTCKLEMQFSQDAIVTEEKRQQDLLHQIEFCGNAKERNKLATQLHKSRNTRRYYKDILEEVEPICSMITAPENHKAFSRLTQLLGQVRKQEQYHSNRVYKPRLKNEPTGTANSK